MKHLKTYESINPKDIANIIVDILDRWEDKLLLDNMKFYNNGDIYLNVREAFTPESYDDFKDLFDTLKKLGLHFEYEGDNLLINYSSFNREEMELLIQTKKFNI